MKRSSKIGLTFVALGFLGGFGGPLVMGEDWSRMRPVALALLLGACFLLVFVVRLREIKEKRK
jgi:hypothetical protein